MMIRKPAPLLPCAPLGQGVQTRGKNVRKEAVHGPARVRRTTYGWHVIAAAGRV